MQPLTPSERETLLKKGVPIEELEEYQRLLSERFAYDFNEKENENDQRRLEELARKFSQS